MMDSMLNEEQEKYLIENYPINSNRAIAKAIGCSTTYVHTFAKRHNLCKERGYLKRVSRSQIRAMADKNKGKPSDFWLSLNETEREAHLRKMRESRKRRIASERRRLIFGLEQKTSLRLSMKPRKEYMQAIQVRHLLRKRGYRCPYGGKEFYYDENTKQILPCKEKKYKEKYGFKFIKYED